VVDDAVVVRVDEDHGERDWKCKTKSVSPVHRAVFKGRLGANFTPRQQLRLGMNCG
jgi:hypothetical protein